MKLARARLEGLSYQLADCEAKAIAGDWLEARLAVSDQLPDRESIELALYIHRDMIIGPRLFPWKCLFGLIEAASKFAAREYQSWLEGALKTDSNLKPLRSTRSEDVRMYHEGAS